MVLAGVGVALAAPLNELHRRGARWDQSCERTIPNSGNTYRVKAAQAFTDASQMALETQQSTDSNGNAFTESTAFSHYFGEGDKDQVKKMMQIIYNSRLPVDENDDFRGYWIDIKCGSDQDKDNCAGETFAATSFEPGKPVIVLCDYFFSPDSKMTKQDLSSKTYGSGRRGWCNTGEEVPYFMVAGVTMLHEMTHLHIVGERAELPIRHDVPTGIDSAGTVDVYVEGSDEDKDKYKGKEAWAASRELHRLWDEYNGDNSKYKPTTPTTWNAESYAAAALEFWFLSKCKWDVILPA